jgi:hypothetical protein
MQNRYNPLNHAGQGIFLNQMGRPLRFEAHERPYYGNFNNFQNNIFDPLNDDNDEQAWQERKRRFLGDR